MLKLKYVRLDELHYFQGNAKLHDLGALAESIKKYGFKNALVIDNNNTVLAGNGRLEVSRQLMEAYEKGLLDAIPENYTVDTDGMWQVPCLPSDFEDVTLATAYVIDDNNLTMMGGDFTALDVSRAYDHDSYMALLKTCIDETISVDGDDLDLMLQLAKGDFNEPEETTYDEPETPEPRATLVITFTEPEQRNLAKSLLENLVNATNLNKGDVVITALEAYLPPE